MTRLTTDPHDQTSPRLGRVRTRWAAIGAAVAVTIGAAGLGGIGIVSADISSGDRPVFVPITPCRLVDTRPAPLNVGVASGTVGPADTYVIQVRGNTDPCPATIPADAQGLSMNVTALGATEQTFLTFWGDGANPGTANLNPAPGQPPVPNAVNTPLGSNGSFQMFNEKGNVNVVIDVNGYYVGHDHDDRYAQIGNVYDKAQADGRYYTQQEVELLIDAARPSVETRVQTGDCNADTTAEECTPRAPAGSAEAHVVTIQMSIAWANRSGGDAYGTCWLATNGVRVPTTDFNMGELVDTTGSLELNYASSNATLGYPADPTNANNEYSILCEEVVDDIDWFEASITTILIPT